MAIRDISDLKVRAEGAAPCLQHGHHVFSLLGKTGLFAINTAWIKLSFGENTSFYVLFIVEYQFSVCTAFSLDTWKFHHTRTCRLSCLSSLASHYVMFSIMIKELLELLHYHYYQFHGRTCE